MSLGVQEMALLVFKLPAKGDVDIVADSEACFSALGVPFSGLLLLSFLLDFGLGREPWLMPLTAPVTSGVKPEALPSRAA